MRRLLLASLLALVATIPPARAADLGKELCAVLAERVDAVPGDGPLFLRSFDGASGSGAPPEPAMVTAAFTYDNALAVVALTACGEVARAKRIGAALLSAAVLDRAGPEGRLRNAYRAGLQKQFPIPPNGWWDGAEGRWLEDDYQVSTATGNVAWAALALLTLAEATGEARFRNGAVALARWVVDRASDRRGPGGFSGGLHGFDDGPVVIGWKSTEHNIDLTALFAWLHRVDPTGGWAAPERRARAFVGAMFVGDRFLIGTVDDGVTLNRMVSALDTQLWPLLLPNAQPEWRSAAAYATRTHAVDGGYDFNEDRDGVWIEGTGQAALTERALGHAGEAARLLSRLAREKSAGGYLWAASVPHLSTGLGAGPAADLMYYRVPHLGATCWAVLAALGWNPFTGQKLP